MDCNFICFGAAVVGGIILAWFLTNHYEKRINELTDEISYCRRLLFEVLRPLEMENKNHARSSTQVALEDVRIKMNKYLFQGVKEDNLPPKSVP
jgi:hypothetical protein